MYGDSCTLQALCSLAGNLVLSLEILCQVNDGNLVCLPVAVCNRNMAHVFVCWVLVMKDLVIFVKSTVYHPN